MEIKYYEIQNKQVNKLAQWVPSGNIIPHTWWTHPLLQRGNRPYVQAILLLADVVYWYRPVNGREENGGGEIGLRQKFRADKLQRSRDDFAQLYGISIKEVADALAFLEKTELICRERRTIVVGGVRSSNVLYIDLNADKIKEISAPSNRTGTSYVSKNTKVVTSKKPARRSEVSTNTKITPQITQKNNNTGSDDVVVSSAELEKLIAMIPAGVVSKAIKTEILQALGKPDGYIIVSSNITYAIKNHKEENSKTGKQQSLGGFIRKAIADDYAAETRLKSLNRQATEEKIRESEEAKIKEQEQEVAKAVAKENVLIEKWRLLPESIRSECEAEYEHKLKLDKFPPLPREHLRELRLATLAAEGRIGRKPEQASL